MLYLIKWQDASVAEVTWEKVAVAKSNHQMWTAFKNCQLPLDFFTSVRCYVSSRDNSC